LADKNLAMQLHYQDISIDSAIVKAEMKKIALHNHNLAIKVVAVLNILFAISDFYTVPEQWISFLVLRLIVTTIFFSVFLLQDRLKIAVEWPGFIAYMGCIIENSYMYSVIDAGTLQKFTFAFIATFIGAGMFSVWRISFSIWAVSISIILNGVLFLVLSPLSIAEYMSNGAFLTLMVAVFSIVLIHTRYNLTIREVTSRLKLELASEEIVEKNKNITDSITYAKRIQDAMLTPPENIKQLFPQSFVIFKPKDIVSGDFYWFNRIERPGQSDIVLAVVADCTGHGVPGALMSMLGISSLSEISNNIENQLDKIPDAGIILNELRNRIKASLRQTGKQGEQKDGMDIAICIFDYQLNTLHFAGANNPMILVRKGELFEYKGDRMPIGIHLGKEKSFTNHIVDIQSDDMVYLFSDGFIDQFGGEAGRKYLIKNLKQLLLSICKEPMDRQKELVEDTLDRWKKGYDQVDDILVIGLKIEKYI
jgi:phosphoserine phosphatase RsbU/P